MTYQYYRVENEEQLQAVKAGEISFIPDFISEKAEIGCFFWQAGCGPWYGCMGSWLSGYGVFYTGKECIWGIWCGDRLFTSDLDSEGRCRAYTPTGVFDLDSPVLVEPQVEAYKTIKL